MLASFGPIATTELFHQPQSSLCLIASAKGLHQALSSLDTAFLENNLTAPFLTTPSSKCAAASSLTKNTSTTSCSVFLLFVAPTGVPAEHGQKGEGEALETGSSASARLRQMWRHPRHRASNQPSQDRQRCSTSRRESSQPRWVNCYLVRLSRIFCWCPLRQQLPAQERPPLSPSSTGAAISFTSIRATSIPATSSSDSSGSATAIYTTSTSETLAQSIPNNTSSPAVSYSSSQSAELQYVLSVLKIKTLSISEHLRKRLIEPHL